MGFAPICMEFHVADEWEVADEGSQADLHFHDLRSEKRTRLHGGMRCGMQYGSVQRSFGRGSMGMIISRGERVAVS